jgi:hypothetical protein
MLMGIFCFSEGRGRKVIYLESFAFIFGSMKIFRIFKRKESRNPEDDFNVTVSDRSVRVQHPVAGTCEIRWSEIRQIKLINTDQGPWTPDIWLALIGNDLNCVIPHGAKGFDEVVERISKYGGFDNHAFGMSMCCAENAEFVLWTKEGS